MGTAFTAKGRSRYTRRWARKPGAGQTIASTRHFTCHIRINSRDWRIDGPASFESNAAEDEEVEFDITLLPLRAGSVLIPDVEVTMGTTQDGEPALPAGGGDGERDELKQEGNGADSSIRAREEEEGDRVYATHCTTRGMRVIVVAAQAGTVDK